MKLKKIISSLFIGGLAISSTAIVSSCTININNSNVNKENNNLNINSIQTKNENCNNMFSSSSLYSEEILGYKDRIPNKTYYDSLLQNVFGDNFKWPTYKFNYNGKNANQLTINLNNSNNTQLFPNGSYRLDNIIYSEGVDNTQKYNKDGVNLINSNLPRATRYNDSNWIIGQINNGTLKRHPIAKHSTDYNNFILDDTKSIIKNFRLSTKYINYIPLGVYCPPGEVIEISFDNQTLDLIKNQPNLTFSINENYSLELRYNKINNHYPFVTSKFAVNSNLDQNGILRIGSPFGGSLSLIINKPIVENNSFPIINFTIKNGIEQLHYVHNLTTIDEWNRQIKDIENRKLTAPISSYVSDYLGTEIPFFKKDNLVNWNIKNIKFPYVNMEKFYQYALLSGYFDNCEKSNRLRRWKLTGENNLNGYGGLTFGSYWTAVPYSEIPSFMFGENFDTRIWTFLHEYNHLHDDFNFGFNQMHDHGPTNIVLRAALSVLDDSGRSRNQFDLSGVNQANPSGWERLNNSYTNLTRNVNWYNLYSAILFQIGTKRYFEWLKDDIRNHKGDQMLQIKNICDRNKLNFYDCAFSTFPYRNNAHWPTNTQTPNAQQQSIINEIRKYPGIDFVGCLYAAGIYIYNSETEEFEYTNDVQPAFEIPPLQKYTFDFDNYIASTNRNFKYTIKVPNKSKYGSILVQNGKKVSYMPKMENLGIIDEFYLDVIPTDFVGKPSLYVPKYKFKIKIRQAVNSPIVSAYKFNKTPDSLSKFLSSSSLDSFSPYAIESISNINEHSDFNMNTMWKMEFKLLPPKTGKYKLYAKKNVQSAIYLDGALIKINEKYSPNYQFICDLNLNKNSIHYFKIILSNILNKYCGVQFYLLDENGKYINLFDYLISPVKELTKFKKQIKQFAPIVSNKFSYKKRWINFDGFQEYSVLASPNQYFDSIIDKTKYKIVPSNLSNSLSQDECNKLLRQNEILSINRSSISFNIKFQNDYDVNGFLFLNGNGTNYFPNNLKIFHNSQLIYNSSYIQSIFNFENKSSKSNTINIFKNVRSNSLTIQLENNKNKIEIDTVSPLNKISNLYSIWSDKLKFDDLWKTIKQNENISFLNNSYKFTNSDSAKLKFKFIGNGFKLFGTLLENLSTQFSVYVDGMLLDNISLVTNKNKYGSIIYQNNDFEYGIHEVEIINNKNSTIYLESIALLGENAFILEK